MKVSQSLALIAGLFLSVSASGYYEDSHFVLQGLDCETEVYKPGLLKSKKTATIRLIKEEGVEIAKKVEITVSSARNASIVYSGEFRILEVTHTSGPESFHVGLKKGEHTYSFYLGDPGFSSGEVGVDDWVLELFSSTDRDFPFKRHQFISSKCGWNTKLLKDLEESPYRLED